MLIELFEGCFFVESVVIVFVVGVFVVWMKKQRHNRHEAVVTRNRDQTRAGCCRDHVSKLARSSIDPIKAGEGRLTEIGHVD